MFNSLAANPEQNIIPIVINKTFPHAKKLSLRGFDNFSGGMFVTKDLLVINLTNASYAEIDLIKNAPLWSSILYSYSDLELLVLLKFAKTKNENGVCFDPSIDMSLWDENYDLPKDGQHYLLNIVLVDSHDEYRVKALRSVTLSCQQTQQLYASTKNQKKKLLAGHMINPVFSSMSLDSLMANNVLEQCGLDY